MFPLVSDLVKVSLSTKDQDATCCVYTDKKYGEWGASKMLSSTILGRDV